MLNRLLKSIREYDRELSVLKRAFIIALVLLAAVFVYTTLSAGLLFTQKSQQKVYCGLTEARNIPELTGSVGIDSPYQLDGCEDVWTVPSNNVKVSKDTASYVEGMASTNLIVAGGISGLIGYYNITNSTGTLDLSNFNSVTFWIKSDTKLDNGTLQLRLSESDDGTGNTENLAIPASALDGANWQKVTVNLSGTTVNYNAVKSVALYAASDPGAVSIWLDIIETQPILSISNQMKVLTKELVT